MTPGPRIAVIVATRDRAAMAADLVARLDDQIRRPDHIFILGAKSSDLELVADRHDITVHVVPDALPALRRQGVKLAGPSYDYLVFFDDSFLPSRLWITQALSYLERWPDVAGVSGLVLTGEQDIFGRGVQSDPILVAMLGDAVHGRPLFFPATCIDGVNMAVRRSALEENDFSEGVFDDFEISASLARSGSIGQLTALFGVKSRPDGGAEKRPSPGRSGYEPRPGHDPGRRSVWLDVERLCVRSRARRQAAAIARTARPGPRFILPHDLTISAGHFLLAGKDSQSLFRSEGIGSGL